MGAKETWLRSVMAGICIAVGGAVNLSVDNKVVGAALFSAGLYPQLKAHLELGKKHGITKEEAVEIVTQLAFYCGWPKAWSTFPLIEEVYGD